MTSFQVRDGARLLKFDGRLLSEVTSRRGTSPRWTEMRLYATESGTYILEKVGRSVVTHMPGCVEIIGKLPRFQEAHPGADPDVEFEFHDCVPDEYNFTELLVEEDRYWATITEDPHAVVEALYRKKGLARHLTRSAIDLLQSAGTVDPAVEAAWRVEHIV